MATKVLELNVDFKEESKVGDRGSFSLQPLERGYGTTIGNAMRRVLLTSIPGAAITHVKIEGVQHEFSTISGVKEDVADIIMNLKKVRFRLMENEPDKITLKFKGKKSFTAQDIQDSSDQFEVLNPEEYITDINSKGKLDIELKIGIGKGYVPSEENDLPNLSVGTLSIDSIFNTSGEDMSIMWIACSKWWSIIKSKFLFTFIF